MNHGRWKKAGVQDALPRSSDYGKGAIMRMGADAVGKTFRSSPRVAASGLRGTDHRGIPRLGDQNLRR
jgi:hypothetical protein